MAILKAVLSAVAFAGVVTVIVMLSARAMDTEACTQAEALFMEHLTLAYQTEEQDAACERIGRTVQIPVRHFIPGGKYIDHAPVR